MLLIVTRLYFSSRKSDKDFQQVTECVSDISQVSASWCRFPPAAITSRRGALSEDICATGLNVNQANTLLSLSHVRRIVWSQSRVAIMKWLRAPIDPGIYIVLFGLTAAIGGCVSPMQFENAEGTNTLEQDKHDCEVLLGYRGDMGETQPTDHMADYLLLGRLKTQSCLERKGWRRTDGEVQAKKSDAGTEQSQLREHPTAEASTFKQKFGIVPGAEVTPTVANLLKMDEVGGVFVAAVYADSVASRAGITKGDVILNYGGKILRTDPNQLKAAVEATTPASVVPITIWRNASKIVLSAQF